MRLPSLLGLVLACSLLTASSSSARASEEAGQPLRAGPLARAKAKKNREEAKAERKKQRQDRGTSEREAGPAPDAPAEEPPSDGIWQWVGRMDGEIPTTDMREQIRAHDEEELALAKAQEEIAKSNHPLYLDLVDPREFDIPVDVTPEVEKWVRYFTGDGRKYYHRWLTRSSRYRPMMYQELEKAGLPRDLVYLSMIESGYNPHAYSSADAAGLWQFISSTGKLYKLRIDWWVDERRDPEHSVKAAIAFLGELNQIFGDWRLAWAGYNTGPGRVRRAVRDSGSSNFWDLSRGPYLHPETDDYVPKIMAAAIIGKHPERYGFTDVAYQEELRYETVHVDGGVSLDTLATCAGTTLEVMKDLNPALRRYATPPEGYAVRIPVGKTDTFVAALAKVPREVRVASVAHHKVQRGETLSGIADRYNVSVSSLSQANNLRNINHIYVGMNLVIPGRGEAPPVVAAAGGTSEPVVRTASALPPKPPAAVAKPSIHTVRSGDTLSEIATRYGVTTTQIKSWNGLSSSTILVGQKLKVGAGSTGGSSASTAAAPVTSKYTIRTGDTLSGIASRFGVRMSDLQRWNNITNASNIKVGQVLVVRGGAPAPTSSAPTTSWTTYKVRSGDSLGAIATRNGCSVKDLMAWNSLKSTTIHPGQTLKIKRG